MDPKVVEETPPDAIMSLSVYIRDYVQNKGSGADGILAELFKIWKDDAVKVLHSIC